MRLHVLSILLALSLALPSVVAASSLVPSLDPVVDETMRGMWSVAWMWDVDGNRIDDRLESADGLSPVAIVVDFDHRPSAEDVATLESLGFATDYRAVYVDSVTGSLPGHLLDEVAALPGVARIEMQLVYYANNNVGTPTIKARPSSTYGNTVWNDLGYRGAGITIAVIDTGVDDHQHEAFTGKYVCGYNAISQSATNPDDDNQHGTHVAGTALGHGGVATYPYGTYAGSAPEAKLVDIKVLDSSGASSGSSVIRGVEWAITNKIACGIDIITLSLGALFGDDGTSSDAQAINRATAAGLIATIAAGNHNTFLEDSIASPGSADTAITVAAMNDKNTVTRNDDTLASFSNHGPRPSDGDADAQDEKKPEVTAPGQTIRSAKYNTANGYADLSGTSMATPMLAGVVAMMLEANAALAWDDVEDIFIETSQDYGTAGWDSSYGYGYVDAYAAVLEAETRAGGATNTAPVAAYSHSTSTLTVNVNGAASSDADGDALSFDWNWGDASAHGAGVTASHTYAAAGTYTVTLTVSDGHGGSDSTAKSVTVAAAANQPPVASFTKSVTGLSVSTDASASSDPDGSIVTYAWNWGDSMSGSGVTATHAYAASGTYTVTLTVTDNLGATAQTTQSVTVSNPSDPDPGATTLTNGVVKNDNIQGAGSEKFYKILVPSGKSNLQVVLDGPACSLLSCGADLDLYVRKGARPTDSAYDCRPYEGDSDETCNLANPAGDWWYVRVLVYSGTANASFTLKATYT